METQTLGHRKSHQTCSRVLGFKLRLRLHYYVKKKVIAFVFEAISVISVSDLHVV